MADVAEFKHTALLTPKYSAIFCSNNFVLGPVVIQPDFKACITSSISASVISGGEKDMFLFQPYDSHSFLSIINNSK
jgi:hypothetical protein